MEEQKSKKTYPQAPIDKNPAKQQNKKQTSKEKQENTEGKVIYVNFMAVVISCVIIFVGIRMVPIKAKGEIASKGVIYEETKEKIEIQDNQEENILEEVIQKENEQKMEEPENVEEMEEPENVQIEENIPDVKEKNIEVLDTPKQKYYIQNVPFINQFNLGYPMGCEAVSATMASRYAGYNVEVETIVANTPTDLKGKRQETITKQVETINEETGEIIVTSEEELVWMGENPFEYFVGDPKKDKTQGAYGCFANPLAIALQKCGISCANISGGSINVLYEYIKQGKPVIVWCRTNAKDLVEGVTWQYPDRKWRIC